ncbi:MAG TPA: lipoyl(octanoyl) transferase LipB [Burkholderiales bacterium]|nr:lipoyl(octanoyl) transferase LipB [Burkholderiales bacterium]
MQFIAKNLGTVDYQESWNAMKEFTENRQNDTPDEFWLLQHNPVFTLGLAGKVEHLLNKNHAIPIIHSDRGGQITFHGHGQIIIYTLIDLKRAKMSVRQLVEKLELGIINYLNTLEINSTSNRCAPGVYIQGKKIASLGLKVRKNCTYHGISFNVSMDITPFNYINVCGYENLQVTQLKEYIEINNIEQIGNKLMDHIVHSIYQN